MISRAHQQRRLRSARCPTHLRSQASTQGAQPNDKKPRRRRAEPDDRAISRFRGGLTTKTHALVDGHGRALALIVTFGQAGDSAVLPRLLEDLRVAGKGPGRVAVISKPADQIANRKGCWGGQPVSYDVQG